VGCDRDGYENTADMEWENIKDTLTGGRARNVENENQSGADGAV
jgi:hypothetical protein